MSIENINPLVSIVTPCYNDGLWIEQTIKSVLDSSYSNIEIIIVDDASTDGRTIDILKTINDPRIKVFFNPNNQGVCFTRNYAVKQSSGKYILPVDADDLISKDYIALATEKLEQNADATIVCCDYVCFGKVNKTVHVEKFDIGKLLAHNLFVVTTMFRRRDFDRINGFNQNMKAGYEDWDFWLSILADRGVVEHITGIHFHYRIKTKSTSRNLGIDIERKRQLRYTIWSNHRELYAKYFVDIFETDEYLSVAKSMEYRLGKMIITPMRKLLKK